MLVNNSGYENPAPGLGLTAQTHYSYESYRPWGSYSGYPGMPAWGGYNWGGYPPSYNYVSSGWGAQGSAVVVQTHHPSLFSLVQKVELLVSDGARCISGGSIQEEETGW